MVNIIKNVALLAASSLMLAGCASTDRPIGLASTVEVAPLSELPAPKMITAYVVGLQETLEISVTDSELLSGTFLTDASGSIAYPLVGDLYVAGKTPRQVERMIAERLRGDFVVNPQVRVRPTVLTEPTISIGGEVTRPGTYPSANATTLLRAVNSAGGLDEYAKIDDVLVMRTVDGQRYIGVYNIEAIQRGNYEDPLIYPQDIITVGDSPGRRRLDSILQYVSLLSTVAILYDRATR